MGQFNSRRGGLQPVWPLRVSNTLDTDYDGLYDIIYDQRQSIAQNLYSLVMTIPGEWPGDDELGAGLPTILFELYNSDILESWKSNLKSQVRTYLDLVKIVKIEFGQSNQDIDNSKSNLTITYTVDLLGIEEKLNIEIAPEGVNQVSLSGIDRLFTLTGRPIT